MMLLAAFGMDRTTCFFLLLELSLTEHFATCKAKHLTFRLLWAKHFCFIEKKRL